jgi:hypothetical protein
MEDSRRQGDTTRTLGVSPSRLNTLINTVKEFTYLTGDNKEAMPDRFRRRERSSKARSGLFAKKEQQEKLNPPQATIANANHSSPISPLRGKYLIS